MGSMVVSMRAQKLLIELTDNNKGNYILQKSMKIKSNNFGSIGWEPYLGYIFSHWVSDGVIG